MTPAELAQLRSDVEVVSRHAVMGEGDVDALARCLVVLRSLVRERVDPATVVAAGLAGVLVATGDGRVGCGRLGQGCDCPPRFCAVEAAATAAPAVVVPGVEPSAGHFQPASVLAVLRRLVAAAGEEGLSRAAIMGIAGRLAQLADRMLGMTDAGSLSPAELLALADQIDGGGLSVGDLAGLLALAHRRAAAAATLDLAAAHVWRSRLERRLLELGRPEVLLVADRQIERHLGEEP